VSRSTRAYSRAMARPSTGIRAVDDLLGAVRVGDNIVYESVEDVSIDALVAAFVKASRAPAGLTYVSFHAPPHLIFDRFGDHWDHERFHLIDCFTDGLGGSDAPFERFYRTKLARTSRITRAREVHDSDAVYATLSADEDGRSSRGRYVFDSLTGMQEMWGAEAALSFFLRMCPRLYELRSVALWILDASAVDASFRARLARVTQVVVRVAATGDDLDVQVVKAEGRAPEVPGRHMRLRFEGGRVVVVQENEADTKQRIGALLKEGRRVRGLSQAELARRIGITASAISQAEHGTAGLSGSTLTRVWEELGMPAPTNEHRFGSEPYHVSRRGARSTMSLTAGVEAEEIANTPVGSTVYIIRVAPRAAGRRPLFATKRVEVVVVVSGVLEVRIGATTEVLQPGDAIVVTNEAIAAWRNIAPHETVLVWSLLPAAADSGLPWDQRR
jgi:transcriptional regulator with XRE-family HTH domain